MTFSNKVIFLDCDGTLMLLCRHFHSTHFPSFDIPGRTPETMKTLGITPELADRAIEILNAP